MALGVTDCLLVLSLVGELPPDFPYAPLFVPEGLDPFDPVVGYAHGHTEVKAHSTGGVRCCKSGHSAHILGNGEGLGIDFVNEHIGESEIFDCIFIHTVPEIVAITRESLSQTVVPIEHTRHPVETEAVYMVFFHPVLAVGQEEELGLILAVIEAAGSPRRMMSLRALVEIYVFASVETAQAFGFIVHRMGVHYVHYDGYALPVSRIHQGLELLRGAETGAESIEVGNLIAE